MSGTISGVPGIIGSGLLAERERMSLIASNMANANSITTPGGKPYRAHEPVFEAAPADNGSSADSVRVLGTVQSSAAPQTRYDPGSPYANAKGYVKTSNVDPVQQMTDLINAANSYKAQIAVLDQHTKLGQAMIQSFIT